MGLRATGGLCKRGTHGYTLLMLATLLDKTRDKKLHNTLLIPLTKVTPARVQAQ